MYKQENILKRLNHGWIVCVVDQSGLDLLARPLLGLLFFLFVTLLILFVVLQTLQFLDVGVGVEFIVRDLV